MPSILSNNYLLSLTCSEIRRLPLPPTKYVRGRSASSGGSVMPKKRKRTPMAQVYERDIICLPLNHPRISGVFSFPRGKLRIDLGRKGLIGKIRLESFMREDEIFAKINSCFVKAFGGDDAFPFKILQSAGTGAKSLIIPSLSDNYEWKAKEVANSGGSRCIYIWAQKELLYMVSIKFVSNNMAFGGVYF